MTISEMRNRSDVFVVVADQNGYITYVHEDPKGKIDWLASDLIGHPISTIIPKNFHDAHHMGFSRFIVTKTPTILNQNLQLPIRTKTGLDISASHLIVAEMEHGEWVFGAIIRA